MTDKQVRSEWTGLKGRIGGWYLRSPLRRLSEILVLGDIKSVFLQEISVLIKGNETILDVGAGSGYFSLAIAEKITTGKVICFDLSDEMLQHLKMAAAKKGLTNRIQIVKGEAGVIKIDNETVDLVVSNGVFHELAQPDKVLQEMVRVLRPDGWVIVTDFRDTRIGNRIAAAHQDGSHGPFSVNELETLFNKVGLKNIKVNPIRHWIIGKGQRI